MAAPGATLREKRREKRTSEILDVALHVFGEKGYVSASMDEIAERSLLTRVALYKYFPDKPSLLHALRAAKLTLMTDRIEADVRAADGFEARVGAVVRAMLAFQDEHPGFFRVLFTASVGPTLKADPAFERLFGVVQGVLSEAGARGDVASDLAPDLLTGLLLSLALEPSIKRNLVHDPGGPLAPTLERLITRVFLEGVRPPSP